MTYTLSNFSRTNSDMAAGASFTAYASGSPVYNATITSGSLYLSSIKTYSGVAYLDFSLGGASASTTTFSSNSSNHGDTVSLSSFSQGLLTAGSGTISFTLRRTNSGSGNLMNIRSGLTASLTLHYNWNYSACGAPTACVVSPTLSEGDAILSWSGATSGISNAINAYEVQYSDSSNNSTWGAWTALSTISTTASSGSVSVAPPSIRGYYRRFQIRTRGTAGASYYSAWKVSSTTLRRNTQPSAPSLFTASPAIYWNQDVVLAWSGAAAGTSAIARYDIQHCNSQDGNNWGSWTHLTSISSASTGGSKTITPSQTQGVYSKYRIATIDTLGVASAYQESNSILCAITACEAPTTCALSAALAEGNVTLSWSGALAGSGNSIVGYELQYSDSEDNSYWSAWQALAIVNTSSTSASLPVAPPEARGSYRRFQVRTRGSAGEGYYSPWKSSGSVRKNILPSPPSVFTASPEVYETNQVTLSWSGIVAGSSAIVQTVLQVATSTNGGPWSVYALLNTVNGSNSSGLLVVTPSDTPRVLTRYRLCVVDALGGVSAYVHSNVVRKLSPPAPPVVLAPQGEGVSYNKNPRFLLRTGDASGFQQALSVRMDAGEWEDSSSAPECFSPSGYLSENVAVVYRHPETQAGRKTVAFRAFAQGIAVPGVEVTRSFMLLDLPLEDIRANETYVKAAHIQALRTAVNGVRSYYGMAEIVWAEEIIAGKTSIRNWTFHVLELRKTIEQIIERIQSFAPDSTLGLSIPDWVPITPGRPKAAVMLQLRELICEL